MSIIILLVRGLFAIVGIILIYWTLLGDHQLNIINIMIGVLIGGAFFVAPLKAIIYPAFFIMVIGVFLSLSLALMSIAREIFGLSDSDEGGLIIALIWIFSLIGGVYLSVQLITLKPVMIILGSILRAADKGDNILDGRK